MRPSNNLSSYYAAKEANNIATNDINPTLTQINMLNSYLDDLLVKYKNSLSVNNSDEDDPISHGAPDDTNDIQSANRF